MAAHAIDPRTPAGRAAVLGLRGLAPPLLALAVAAGGWGCSQAPAPETAAAAVEEDAAAAAAVADAAERGEAEESGAAAVAAGSDPAPEAAAAKRDATVILIERGERQKRPATLYEASVAARAQRGTAGPSKVAVTDDNLHEFQGSGLTFASADEESEDGEAGEEGEAGAVEAARGEEYWRSRVLDLRLRLREAVDELEELEGRAASLRRSFYAEDDPYVRDGEIKPAWDRALDRVVETRESIFRLRDELDRAVEEGREAGALPGWLREGIELEPEPDELPRPRESTHEPGEPRIFESQEPPA